MRIIPIRMREIIPGGSSNKCVMRHTFCRGDAQRMLAALARDTLPG
jgi:hypothetical protein